MKISKIITNASIILLAFIMIGCNSNMKNESNQYIYNLKKNNTGHQITANFNSNFWNTVEPVELVNYMGEKPQHFPTTKAKLAYDTRNIYVIFNVRDQYVIAASQKYQDTPWLDSCVEFFFTPSDDITEGYFNLEMTCVGHFLFHYHKGTGSENTVIDISDCKKIQVAASLKGPTIQPEIQHPTTWTVEYKIPFAVIEKYINKPVGNTWKANLYKCADKSSHPHWLTWAPVDYPKPSFHKPEFFGTLKFNR